jgi:hypothetical protein
VSYPVRHFSSVTSVFWLTPLPSIRLIAVRLQNCLDRSVSSDTNQLVDAIPHINTQWLVQERFKSFGRWGPLGHRRRPVDREDTGSTKRHFEPGTYQIRTTGWTIRGSNSSRVKRFLSSSKRSDCFWGPPSLLFIRYRGSFPRLKRPGREDDHSTLSTFEVKREWSYSSTTPIRLHDVDSDIFTVTCQTRRRSATNTIATWGTRSEIRIWETIVQHRWLRLLMHVCFGGEHVGRMIDLLECLEKNSIT